MPRVRDLLTLGLTASATPATNDGRGTRPQGRIPGTGGNWQEKAWRYHDEVGEIGYASNFYARPMSRVDTFPQFEAAPGVYLTLEQLEKIIAGEPPPDGVDATVIPSEDEVAQARQAWDEFQDRGGGREEMQAGHGKLSFINGEMWLAQLWDDDEEAPYWAIRSKFELQPKQGEERKWELIPRKDAKQDQRKVLTEPEEGAAIAAGEVKPYRLWTPRGDYSEQADAPMRQVIERSEELILASRSIKATLRSRVARSGILYANGKLFPGITPASLKPGEPHPFLQQLGEHMMKPLEGDGDASEVVPYLITGNLPASEKAFERVTFSEGLGYPELPVQEALIRRIATSLDMPAEYLLGMADVNHWTGWLVKEEQWSHVDPVMRRFCSDVTAVYLRPVLKSLGVQTSRKWSVGYDPSPAIVKPDRGKDADAAHDRGAISDRAYREARGFKEDDAPSDEEPNSNPRVIAAENGGSVDGGAETSPNEGTPATMKSEVQAAADVALHRCRELAGARIRGRLKATDPQLLEQIREDGIENVDLAAYLGEQIVKQNMNGQGNAATLVQTGSKCFAAAMSTRLESTRVNLLQEVIEVYAAQTLYQREPGRVPV